MLEVIARLQGKREFNEMKGHIFRLLFIPDSSEVPLYGELAKKLSRSLEYSIFNPVFSVLNLKFVSAMNNLVWRNQWAENHC